MHDCIIGLHDIRRNTHLPEKTLACLFWWHKWPCWGTHNVKSWVWLLGAEISWQEREVLYRKVQDIEFCQQPEYLWRGFFLSWEFRWDPISSWHIYCSLICTQLVQFSHSLVSNSLQPDGLQHTRLPCPSPTFRVYSNSCPLSQWCHPTISSCRLLFILLSIFPSIRVFSSESVLCIRWPKYWSFSFSISPSNEYPGLISLGWTGWVSLQSKGLSRVFSNTTVQKHHFFSAQLSLLSHPYMTTGKTIALTRWTFVGKVMSLLFNISLGWSQLFFPGASVF